LELAGSSTSLTPATATEFTITLTPAVAVLSFGTTTVAFDETGEPTGLASRKWLASYALSPLALDSLKSVIDSAVERLKAEPPARTGVKNAGKTSEAG
jgi:hypothetical protein